VEPRGRVYRWIILDMRGISLDRGRMIGFITMIIVEKRGTYRRFEDDDVATQ
jgi:hypothetical protein